MILKACAGECRNEAFELSNLSGEAEPASALVQTRREASVIRSLVPWLQTGMPLLLVGPQGCGKATLMQHCFSQLVRLRTTC